jgi:prolyl-tRNA editing enzyme YbaK/EbsC (Cys-tRNA(Pro) deacylase)
LFKKGLLSSTLNFQESEKMNKVLTKNAQSIQDVLRDQGIERADVIELSDSTRTAVDAAAALGCDVAQIVKSLIFKTQETEKAVLILVSGKNRVDERIIASHMGEKITKADAAFTREVTGFAIGGIPPLGHKQVIPFIFIDEALLGFESVWAAAGTPNAVVNLQTKDFLQVSGGKVISL